MFPTSPEHTPHRQGLLLRESGPFPGLPHRPQAPCPAMAPGGLSGPREAAAGRQGDAGPALPGSAERVKGRWRGRLAVGSEHVQIETASILRASVTGTLHLPPPAGHPWTPVRTRAAPGRGGPAAAPGAARGRCPHLTSPQGRCHPLTAAACTSRPLLSPPLTAAALPSGPLSSPPLRAAPPG